MNAAKICGANRAGMNTSGFVASDGELRTPIDVAITARHTAAKGTMNQPQRRLTHGGV